VRELFCTPFYVIPEDYITAALTTSRPKYEALFVTIPMRFYHNYTTTSTSQIANKASTLYSCSYKPTKMGDCYHSLSKSISSSSKWTPHIMVKSTHFREDSEGIITPNYSGTVELVDICQFFDQSHCIAF
jgi:hypothetical protein